MRLKNAALFCVCFLAVTFGLHGGARCQSSLAPPLSLAPPAFDQASPAEATRNLTRRGVVDPWKTIRRRGSEDPLSRATKNDRMPTASEDAPEQTAASAPSAAAKNSARPATAKGAPALDIYNVSPDSGLGKPSPSGNYDGFTVGTDEDEQAGQPLPRARGPSKQSSARPKHDRSPPANPLDDQAEVEKLKTKLLICRGC